MSKLARKLFAICTCLTLVLTSGVSAVIAWAQEAEEVAAAEEPVASLETPLDSEAKLHPAEAPQSPDDIGGFIIPSPNAHFQDALIDSDQPALQQEAQTGSADGEAISINVEQDIQHALKPNINPCLSSASPNRGPALPSDGAPALSSETSVDSSSPDILSETPQSGSEQNSSSPEEIATISEQNPAPFSDTASSSPPIVDDSDPVDPAILSGNNEVKATPSPLASPSSGFSEPLLVLDSGVEDTTASASPGPTEEVFDPTGTASVSLADPGSRPDLVSRSGLEEDCTPIEAHSIVSEDGSIIEIEELRETIVEIVNTNEVTVTNQTAAEAVTGQNRILAEDGENAAIGTGEINLFANVLNIVNTNLLNSQITEIFENFNDFSSNLILDHPETQPAQVSRDLAMSMCSSITCESVSSYKLTNRNDATILNDVSVFGHSGLNDINGIEQNANIQTGNVNAVVNILNIVNSNLINSRWTISSINVFGDWEGDLVLPSELYFTGYGRIGAADESSAELEEIHKVTINIKNQNDAEIENTVLVDSASGENAVFASGSAGDKEGDAQNNTLETGEAVALSNVKTVVNTNIYNGKWYLGMINMLGQWSGDIFSLPDQVAMAVMPTGLSFFAATTEFGDQAILMFQDEMAKLSQTSTTSLDIINDNTTSIDNVVDLRTYSGQNSIAADEVKDSTIQTGTTRALANILNFANTNLINADIHVGLINILGSWKGNILFGYPDLAVSHTLDDELLPYYRGGKSEYKISYANRGKASMLGAIIEFHFDADKFSVSDVDNVDDYTIVRPGLLRIELGRELGRLAAQQSGELDIELKNIRDLENIGEVTTYARISGIGPEWVSDNNESYLVSSVAPPPQVGGGGSSPTNPVNSPSHNTYGVDASNRETNAPPPNSNSAVEDNSFVSSLVLPEQISTIRPAYGITTGTTIQYHDLIRAYKTNKAPPIGAEAGEVIEFAITVHNDGLNDLSNIVVYDTLRAPDGTIAAKNEIPLGDVVSREEVVIPYTLQVPANVPAGRYTNTAYAEGFSPTLQMIRSESALSSFSIINQTPRKNTAEKKPDQDASLRELPIKEQVSRAAEILKKSTARVNPITVAEAEAAEKKDLPVNIKKDQRKFFYSLADKKNQTAVTDVHQTKKEPDGRVLQLFLNVAAIVLVLAIAFWRRKRAVMLIFIMLFLPVYGAVSLLTQESKNVLAALNCQTPLSVSFPFAVQSDTGGVFADSNGRIKGGDVRSNADIQGGLLAQIEQNAIAVGMISGINITGSASSGASPATLPAINEADWQSAAELGGTVGGITVPTNSSGNKLGPVKIIGNLILEPNSEVIIQGTIHVTGDLIVRGNARFVLDPSFGSSGTMIFVAGHVDIDGNATVAGTNGGGFLLIVSSKNMNSDSIVIQSNFIGRTVIFYSLHGGVRLLSNSQTIALYGNKVEIGKNSLVSYVPGLKFATFICPPPTPTPTPPFSPTPTATPTSMPTLTPSPAVTPTPALGQGGGGGGEGGGGGAAGPLATPAVLARIKIEAPSQKTVAQAVSERIMVFNDGTALTPAGILEIFFPAQVQYISSTSKAVKQIDGVVQFSVGNIAAGGFFELVMEVLPLTATGGAETYVRYLVANSVVASASTNERIIKEMAGGEITPALSPLPRTGADQRFDLGSLSTLVQAKCSISAPDSYTLHIASLNIHAPVIFPAEAKEVTYQQALHEGIAHLPGTALPGEIGNVYLFGHSSDYLSSPGAFKHVFASLPRIKIGDLVTIADASGNQWNYRIIKTAVISKYDGSVIVPPDNKGKYVTLQTSFPIGTADKRFIVVGVVP